MKYLLALGGLLLVLAVIGVIFLMSGEGGFKRMVTLSGIYSVCKPDGYETVCFLDADGNDGGMFCLPLKDVTPDGKCKGEK